MAPKSAGDCCFLFGFSLHLPVEGSAITLVVSRLQSSLRAYFALMLRPASWLALLSRTFTFELALAGSPRTNVKYDYVGKQSIPTTGLSPASPTALWAAELGPTPATNLRSIFSVPLCLSLDLCRVRRHKIEGRPFRRARRIAAAHLERGASREPWQPSAPPLKQSCLHRLLSRFARRMI